MAGAKVENMRQAGKLIALRLQSISRGNLARKEIAEKKSASIKIQAVAKGRIQRNRVKLEKEEKALAVTKLQAVQRGRQQKKKFRKKMKIVSVLSQYFA